MEEEMDKILLPAENQRFAVIRYYGLLLFLAASVVLTLVALATLIRP
jgi:hypothetical protein